MLRLPGPPGPHPMVAAEQRQPQTLTRREKHHQAHQPTSPGSGGRMPAGFHYLLVFGTEGGGRRDGVWPAGRGRGGAGKGHPPRAPFSSRLCTWMCHADLLRGLWRLAEAHHGPARGWRDLETHSREALGSTKPEARRRADATQGLAQESAATEALPPCPTQGAFLPCRSGLPVTYTGNQKHHLTAS